MGDQRADLGFGDPLDNFDPSEWQPAKLKTAANKPEAKQAAEIAEASGFKSREPKEAERRSRGGEVAPVRRRRTGRNAQFNLKAKPETIEAYCAIADKMSWGLGETLEKAVELLEREYRS